MPSLFSLTFGRTAAAFAVFCTLTLVALSTPDHVKDHPLSPIIFEEIADEDMPEITLVAKQRQDRGWSLEILSDELTFVDLCKPGEHYDRVVHAHVFREGEHLGRANVPEFDLGRLEPGANEIWVNVRASNHKVLAGRRGTVSSKIVIMVPEDRGITL